MYFLSAVFVAVMALSSFVQEPLPLEWNKKSILTSDWPIELPGMILVPGSYVVRLHESGETRSLVQILDRQEGRVIATLTAVPDHHTRPEGDVEFSYHTVKGDSPKPVKSWFHTNDIIGLQFVYPIARAKELAKAAGSHVIASNPKDGAIVAVTPNGKEIVIDEPVQTARRKPQ